LGRRGTANVDEHDILLQAIRFVVVVNVDCADLSNDGSKAIEIGLVEVVRDDCLRYRGPTLATPEWRFVSRGRLFLEIFPGGAEALY
jgi:hypothetical protein